MEPTPVLLLAVQALPTIPLPTRVLMATPEHFRVDYVINPHMEGNIGEVDLPRARAQWEALKDTYQSLGMDVHVVKGVETLPDMVFCANQTLPYRTPSGAEGVVLSRMHAPQRKPEVAHFAEFFQGIGYETRHLDDTAANRHETGTAQSFEGMGDAIWHPGRYLLWGGHGFRTDESVYGQLTEQLGVPVISLNLSDAEFYHLDTCFCPLDERTVLIYPAAFDAPGLDLIHAHFDRVIEAPEDEARHLFACNAHTPDCRHVIIQRGCEVTNRLLRAEGFEVIEVETDEFLKSGGSVFCMKLMFW